MFVFIPVSIRPVRSGPAETVPAKISLRAVRSILQIGEALTNLFILQNIFLIAKN